MPAVTSQEMALIADFVETHCGIVLSSSKSYLVESRLGPLLRREKVPNYAALITKARKDVSGNLKRNILDSISTNETYFFRDGKPFELLAHKILPDILEPQLEQSKGKPTINIWSAAASTGQEIYSIAMVLKEMLGDLMAYNIHILGTDISEAALEIASRGLYGKVELARGLSGPRLHKHFSRHENLWKVSDELRSLVQFKRANLLEPLKGVVGKQDIILCRNVAIYFSKDNKVRLYEQISNHLKPGGVLLIGTTETLLGVSTKFEKKEFHNNVYYQLPK